jgi:hypothetical protein
MKNPEYRGCLLMPNSRAYELYLQWKKTNSNKDRDALDLHMRVVEHEAKELMKRYPSV